MCFLFYEIKKKNYKGSLFLHEDRIRMQRKHFLDLRAELKALVYKDVTNKAIRFINGTPEQLTSLVQDQKSNSSSYSPLLEISWNETNHVAPSCFVCYHF